jgi:DNA repair exonuclease SbcCD nuclease subunit
MSDRSFRFLHASDLHLELPFQGLAEVPEHLQQRLLDAPFRAAKQVFEAAIAEQVEFVVLSGDVINPELAGPRAIMFLVKQFEQLAQRNIPVYWAAGRVDSPDRWPSAVSLPDNVHVFPKSAVEQITHASNDEPLATITGRSRSTKGKIKAAQFEPDTDALYCIAAVHADLDERSLAGGQADYWALGGKHERKTVCRQPCTAHYPGTPQGRAPADTGPRGCTLVEVEPGVETRLRFVPADAVRWHAERVALEPGVNQGDLIRELSERMQALTTEAGRDLLVTWNIVTDGQLSLPLRRGGLADEIVERLRREFGHATTAAWTVSLTVEPPSKLPRAWYEEDTILGDFVRALKTRQSKRNATVDLSEFLPARHRGTAMEEALKLSDPSAREAVLQGATLLGINLLRGGDPLSGSEALATTDHGHQEMPR